LILTVADRVAIKGLITVSWTFRHLCPRRDLDYWINRQLHYWHLLIASHRRY